MFNCATQEEQCSECLSGFVLNSNRCINTQPSCTAVRQEDGLCSECAQGYSLEGFDCVPEGGKIENCYLTSTIGTCPYCKSGFSYFQGKCHLPKEIEAIVNGSNGQTSARTVTTTSTTTTNSGGGFTQTTQSSSSFSGFGGSQSTSSQQTESNQSGGGFSSQEGGFSSQGGFSSGSNINSSFTNSQSSVPIVNCVVENGGRCVQCTEGYVPDENG